MGKRLYYGQPINRGWGPNRGLVSRWQVVPWYASGPRFIDLASTNHGTLTNGPTWQGALGRPGGFGSISAAAGSELIDGGTVAALPTGATAAFSFGFWHNTRAIVSLAHAFGWGATLPIDSTTANNGERRSVLQYVGNYYFWGESADWDTGIAWNTGGWFRIDFTGDGTNLRLYRNGVLAAGPQAYPAFAAISPGPILAAFSRHSGAASSPNMLLDDCTACDRALSASEVYALYEDSIRGNPQGLNWISTRTYFGVAAAGGVASHRNQMLLGVGSYF